MKIYFSWWIRLDQMVKTIWMVWKSKNMVVMVHFLMMKHQIRNYNVRLSIPLVWFFFIDIKSTSTQNQIFESNFTLKTTKTEIHCFMMFKKTISNAQYTWFNITNPCLYYVLNVNCKQDFSLKKFSNIIYCINHIMQYIAERHTNPVLHLA
jgi:hypothetical protein